MGGNALAEFGAQRVSRKEFDEMVESVEMIIPAPVHHIPYVREKDSFGDLDLIVSKNDLTPREFVAFVRDVLGVPYVKNGPVVSFLHAGKLQVDVIFMKDKDVEFAVNYFSYNDLGNLIGRIAHKMGLKFGHDGLWLIVRDGDYKLGEIRLTREFPEALEFLGYDYITFKCGFDTFDDMFFYASCNQYFSPSIYLLENRNHTARVRDRKRTSYMNFLKWVDNNRMRLEDFRWEKHPKSEWLPKILERFPEAKEEYDLIQNRLTMSRASKEKFPTTEIMDLTGLQGKELGEFKGFLTRNLPDMYDSYHAWVLDNHVCSLRSFVLRIFDLYQETKR